MANLHSSGCRDTPSRVYHLPTGRLTARRDRHAPLPDYLFYDVPPLKRSGNVVSVVRICRGHARFCRYGCMPQLCMLPAVLPRDAERRVLTGSQRRELMRVATASLPRRCYGISRHRCDCRAYLNILALRLRFLCCPFYPTYLHTALPHDFVAYYSVRFLIC